MARYARGPNACSQTEAQFNRVSYLFFKARSDIKIGCQAPVARQARGLSASDQTEVTLYRVESLFIRDRLCKKGQCVLQLGRRLVLQSRYLFSRVRLQASGQAPAARQARGLIDFYLGGHFKGHLGKNVGFIAYSYIIIVNNLKMVMISRQVYII